MARQKRQRKQILKEFEQQKAAHASVDADANGSAGANAAAPLSLRCSSADVAPLPPRHAPPGPGKPPPPATMSPGMVPLPLRGPLALPPENGGGGGGLQAQGAASSAVSLEWLNSEKRYRCFALNPRFLSEEDINAIHAVAQHPSVKEINDRKGYLAFKHRVWRFEAQLRAVQPGLYNRLIGLMQMADQAKWRRLQKNSKRNRVFPEIEYISYDVAEMGMPCYIEPHVDNKSAVTLVAMLSARGEYVGGCSCFRRADGRKGHRQLELEQGDVVLFRGEKLTHWITPVLAGRRVILQIELSRV